MIINSLSLQNIRSYKDAQINFPKGTTLFEGDIGSGKSTILMAIEFALFGLGSERGSSLLRTGETEGKVELNFEIDDKKYEIIRTLVRKRDSAHQSQCQLKSEQKVFHLSPTEMKEKILDILNFNEPQDPKANSIIYRYAVFTPQEEMKTILFLRPDLRLQTLRKAFGVEDYKIASENAAKLSRSFNIRIKELESAAEDLEEIQNKIHEKKEEIEKESIRLHKSSDEEARLEVEIKIVKDDIFNLQEKKINLNKIIGSLPILEKVVDEKSKQVEDLIKKINGHQKKIDEMVNKAKEIETIDEPTGKKESELQQELKQIEEEERRFRNIETEIKAKLIDYRSIERSKICPTCDRAVDPKDFEKKIESKLKEMNSASIGVMELEKKIESTKELLKKLQDYVYVQEKLKELREHITYYNDDMELSKVMIENLKLEIKNSEKEISATKEEKVKLETISKRIQQLQDEYKKLENQAKFVRDELTRAKTRINDLNQTIKDLQEQIKKKMKQRNTAAMLNEYRIWLDDFFIPTLDIIEKHVMININQDLNLHFQKWFNMLVEDPSKEARIDEDFTPIVEQDGYEQDLYYLSGGEKTSIAFAYRVALNDIVRKVSTGMKSNLLIFDEPTDGLSKEQLSRVREIIDELYCPQIIIVSHEKELESFADQIFRVRKTQGESKIVH